MNPSRLSASCAQDCELQPMAGFGLPADLLGISSGWISRVEGALIRFRSLLILLRPSRFITRTGTSAEASSALAPSAKSYRWRKKRVHACWATVAGSPGAVLGLPHRTSQLIEKDVGAIITG